MYQKTMRVGTVVEVKDHPLAGQLARISEFKKSYVQVQGNGWNAKLHVSQIIVKLYQTPPHQIERRF